MLRRAVIAGLGLLLACGPTPPADASTTAASTSTSSPTTTTADPPPPASSTTTTAPDPTTTAATCVDLCDTTAAAPDLPPFACDLLAQDCPPDFKCVPDGWSGATRCAPLARDPAAVGELCGFTDDGDDCGPGAICWDFPVADPFCVALCVDGDGCPAATDCDPFDVVGLCLPACDPLASTCADDEVCLQIVIGTRFVCHPGSGHLGPGVGCFPTECQDGLACAAVPCGLGDGQPGCCTPYCDLTAPACPDELECAPALLPPLPGADHIGICRDLE